MSDKSELERSEQSDEIARLRELYYSPKTGYRTAGYYKLLVNLPFADIQKFIDNQEVKQIHTTVPKSFIHIVNPELGNYQVDLMFMNQYKDYNDGYHVFLNAIEITSRKAYIVPMKSKSKNDVYAAFNTLVGEIQDHRESNGWKKIIYRIKSITTDLGSEFISKQFRELMQQYHIITFFAARGDKYRMGLIERFNRTIREMIEQYITANHTYRFVDVLPELLENHNNNVHSTTKIAPNKVTATSAKEIYNKLLDDSEKGVSKYDEISVGDRVRHLVSRAQRFVHGKQLFSKRIYTVESKHGYSYKLVGIDREFKRYELLKIDSEPEKLETTGEEIPTRNELFAINAAKKRARRELK